MGSFFPCLPVMHAENTEIVTVPRTYWSQDWIGHQNLSLGDQDLGRIDQGTRLSDFEDFNPLESLSTPIFRLPYRKFKAIIVIQEKRPSPKKKKKNQKPYRKVFVFIQKNNHYSNFYAMFTVTAPIQTADTIRKLSFKPSFYRIKET